MKFFFIPDKLISPKFSSRAVLSGLLLAEGIRALVNGLKDPLAMAILHETDHLVRRSYPNVTAIAVPQVIWAPSLGDVASGIAVAVIAVYIASRLSPAESEITK